MIHLLPLDEPGLDRLVGDPEDGLRKLVSNGPEVFAFLVPVLRQSLEFHRRVGSQPPWHSYFGVESDGNRLVGVCSFKGNPTPLGEVEIAYGAVPGFEGRGYATEMALGLVDLAFRSPNVTRVIAHTLPEPNASTRVLKKAGLMFAGEVMDPEDGRVWRWEIVRPAAR